MSDITIPIPSDAKIHRIASPGHVLLERVNAYWHKTPLAIGGVVASLILGYFILLYAPVIASYPARFIGWIASKTILALCICLAVAALGEVIVFLTKPAKLAVTIASHAVLLLFLVSACYFGYVLFAGKSATKPLAPSPAPAVKAIMHRLPATANFNADAVLTIAAATDLMRTNATLVAGGGQPTGCVTDRQITALWTDGTDQDLKPKCRVGADGRLWMWGFAKVPATNATPEVYGTFVYLSIKTANGARITDVRVPPQQGPNDSPNLRGMQAVSDTSLFPRAVANDFPELRS